MSTPSEASTPQRDPAFTPALSSTESQAARRLDWLQHQNWPGLGTSGERKARRVAILDRYLLAEVATPFVFGVLAFAVFLLINQFFLAAEFVINKHVPFVLVCQYLVLQIPSFVYMIFPFATMFGVLQGFGRLAGDNELTAMRTSGIALERIARPIFALGIVLTLAAFAVNDYIAPESQHKSQTIFREIAYHSSQPIIEPDQFVRTEDGQHTIFVGSMDSQTGIMQNVAIYSLGTGNFPETLTASTARQINGKLVLYNGVHTTNGPNGLVVKQTRFNTLEFPLTDASLLFEGPRGPFEMSSSELSHQIKALKGSGEDTSQMEMVLQMKFAMPLACLISILIALPLAVRFGKRGREVGAMLALIVLLIYWLAITAFNTLGKNGAIPPLLAAWLPNLFMGGVGAALLWKEGR
ncbi:MAG TPA: LptF/LptG family permease [Candidatus Acidoferrales bacterium]|nr:LptF/LptG family permease [Candidatus Acidoferrales bacterium]